MGYFRPSTKLQWIKNNFKKNIENIVLSGLDVYNTYQKWKILLFSSSPTQVRTLYIYGDDVVNRLSANIGTKTLF